MSRAAASTSSPYGLGCTPRASRSKSRTPSSASTRASMRERVGCGSCSAAAASVTCSCSASTRSLRKSSRCTPEPYVKRMRTLRSMHWTYVPAPRRVGCMSVLHQDLTNEGYRAGEAGYRRIATALFAAGVATFALLYSTQALLPELADAFAVTAAQSTLSLSLTTVGLGVALLVAGPLSEVVGRTRLIHLSLALSALVAL